MLPSQLSTHFRILTRFRIKYSLTGFAWLLFCLMVLTACSENRNSITPEKIIRPAGASLTGASKFEISEPETRVGTLSTDKENVTYQINGGPDRDFFTLDEKSGTLSFIDAPDFEQALDHDRDNHYLINIGISDGTVENVAAVEVIVNNINDNPPSFAALKTFKATENSKPVIAVSANDPDNDPLFFEITGGEDFQFFAIDAENGFLSFVDAPNFEDPQDKNKNNHFNLTIQVSDLDIDGNAVNTVSDDFTVVVENINDLTPILISATNVSYKENDRVPVYLRVIDQDNTRNQVFNKISYFLSGGADKDKFNLNFSNGHLLFKTPPDFEKPNDANLDNIYEVEFIASDGLHEIVSSVSIKIDDALELNLSVSHKNIHFSWSPFANSNIFRLFSKSERHPEFTQVGTDFTPGEPSFSLPIGAHRFEWDTTEFKLEAFSDTALQTTSNIIRTKQLGTLAVSKVKAKVQEPLSPDNFGQSVAISGDGLTMAVGAPAEDSASTGIDGNAEDNGLENSGAVYIFTRAGNGWVQQSYIKALNPDINDAFGWDVALNDNGNTLVVSAYLEDSNATGVSIGNSAGQANNGLTNAGAVYVFTRSAGEWRQQSYIKPSVSNANEWFGYALDISNDGKIIAVGSFANNFARGSVTTFSQTGNSWVQQATLKAGISDSDDGFGRDVSLNDSGTALAIGAWKESSASTGINKNASNNNATSAGAAYVFSRTGSAWNQTAYVKASNAQAFDRFGSQVAISGDGNTLAVTAELEDSAAVLVNGDQNNELGADSGAVYLFKNAAGWTQQAYLKPNFTNIGGGFGSSLTLNSAGTLLVVGHANDHNSGNGLNQTASGFAQNAGAAHTFIFNPSSATWEYRTYIKSLKSNANDLFGNSVSLDTTGDTLAIGAPEIQKEVGPNETYRQSSSSHAVYVY